MRDAEVNALAQSAVRDWEAPGHANRWSIYEDPTGSISQTSEQSPFIHSSEPAHSSGISESSQSVSEGRSTIQNILPARWPQAENWNSVNTRPPGISGINSLENLQQNLRSRLQNDPFATLEAWAAASIFLSNPVSGQEGNESYNFVQRNSEPQFYGQYSGHNMPEAAHSLPSQLGDPSHFYPFLAQPQVISAKQGLSDANRASSGGVIEDDQNGILRRSPRRRSHSLGVRRPSNVNTSSARSGKRDREENIDGGDGTGLLVSQQDQMNVTKVQTVQFQSPTQSQRLAFPRSGFKAGDDSFLQHNKAAPSFRSSHTEAAITGEANPSPFNAPSNWQGIPNPSGLSYYIHQISFLPRLSPVSVMLTRSMHLWFQCRWSYTENSVQVNILSGEYGLLSA